MKLPPGQMFGMKKSHPEKSHRSFVSKYFGRYLAHLFQFDLFLFPINAFDRTGYVAFIHILIHLYFSFRYLFPFSIQCSPQTTP